MTELGLRTGPRCGSLDLWVKIPYGWRAVAISNGLCSGDPQHHSCPLYLTDPMVRFDAGVQIFAPFPLSARCPWRTRNTESEPKSDSEKALPANLDFIEKRRFRRTTIDITLRHPQPT